MISIVIATKNRSDFLIRLLNYYVATDYKYWVCIGDSSDFSHLEKTRETIKFFEGKLKIKYYEYPGLNIAECHKQLLSSILTPYVACVSDSGFLVPNSLKKCVKFLDTHSDYSVAHGLGALFILKQEGPFGQFKSIGKYGSLSKTEEEAASARLIHHLDKGNSTVYCVYRTNVWKGVWRNTDSIKDWSFAGEILPCCLTAIYGKAKELDCLYLVRQLHNQRVIMTMPKTYEWLASPDWYPSYQIFHDCLVSALVKQDGIDEKKAHEVVKRAFWSNLSKCLNRSFQNQYYRSKRERIKDKLKALPGLTACVSMIKSSMFFSKTISLAALLSERSRYHDDFIPIYNSITKAGLNIQVGKKEKVC